MKNKDKTENKFTESMASDYPRLLEMVEIVRRVWGKDHAQAFWRQSELPEIMKSQAALDVPDSVTKWLADCTTFKKGARTLRSSVYKSYFDYAEEWFPQTVSQQALYKILEGRGFYSVKSGQLYLTNIVLREGAN